MIAVKKNKVFAAIGVVMHLVLHQHVQECWGVMLAAHQDNFLTEDMRPPVIEKSGILANLPPRIFLLFSQNHMRFFLKLKP